jgi:hypothetical protein
VDRSLSANYRPRKGGHGLFEGEADPNDGTAHRECTRAQVIESLRQAIPADLVDDIFIDNVRWSE